MGGSTCQLQPLGRGHLSKEASRPLATQTNNSSAPRASSAITTSLVAGTSLTPMEQMGKLRPRGEKTLGPAHSPAALADASPAMGVGKGAGPY